jgi:hypothetical protein
VVRSVGAIIKEVCWYARSYFHSVHDRVAMDSEVGQRHCGKSAYCGLHWKCRLGSCPRLFRDIGRQKTETLKSPLQPEV